MHHKAINLPVNFESEDKKCDKPKSLQGEFSICSEVEMVREKPSEITYN